MKIFFDRCELLNEAARIAQLLHPKLDWAEFGVGYGTSARQLLSLLPLTSSQKLFLFDSFQGLPEEWRAGFPKGFFACQPPVFDDQRAEVITGWFNDTLPQWVRMHPKPLGLLHIDCDLYSSTLSVLTHLHSHVLPGTVMVFDEFWGYPGWDFGEYKAFQEFVSTFNKDYQITGATTLESNPEHGPWSTGQQCLVQILS